MSARSDAAALSGTRSAGEAERRVIISANTAWNIANFRSGLIKALLGVGYEVVAVAPSDEHMRRVEALGCRFIPITMDNKGANPLRDLSLLSDYARIFRRERPAAFLGYTIKPNVYGTLAASSVGVPAINNISGLGTAFIRTTWLTPVVKALYRAALSRSRIVFFQNEDDRSLFVERKLVALAKTDVLAGSGIDTQRFSPSPRISAGGEPKRFLLIARLLWDKGVQEYVDAARHLRARHPRVQFQILGFLDVENRTAVGRSDVENWVREGLIDYLGAADDVRPFIAQADCIVLPSYREGTARTLLEAAAMAKPLIATDVPGCRNVVAHGQNGLLCRVRDAQDLARQMEAFMSLSAEEIAGMGQRSRQKMEREFDERLVVDRYLQALGETSDHVGRSRSAGSLLLA